MVERLRDFVERGRRAQAAVDAAGAGTRCAVCGQGPPLVEVGVGLERAAICSIACGRRWVPPRIAVLLYGPAGQGITPERMAAVLKEGEWPVNP